jgi:hypothetical protein
MRCENCNAQHDGKYGSGRFCSKFCSKSFSSNKNKEIKNKKISESLKGKFIGLENSYYKNNVKEQKIEKCPICNSEFNKSYSKIYCSRNCYISDKEFKFRKKSSGGYRKGSGVGKKGWYKGYWCDSSWELAFVIYNLENNIYFKRIKKSYTYTFENKEYKYYPDYEMNDGSIIEIKGYETKKDIEKYKVVDNLKVLYRKDITKYIDYSISKYGKDYIKLYEVE